MTWENHGKVWHVDHYYPLSKAFKHSDAAFKKACHYTNLRPLKKKQNLKKHAKIPSKFKNIEDFLSYNPIPIKPFSWDD